MKLVVVATYGESTEAYLAKITLADEGIEAGVAGEGLGYGSTRAELFVWEDDYERALELVGDQAQPKNPFAGEVLLRHHRWIPVLPVAVLVFLGARLLFSFAYPESAAKDDFQYLLFGPLVGMLAACVMAPKWKLGIAVLSFGFLLQIARSL